MSFLDLIKGEALPRPPVVEDPDVDKFNRDMVDYLRKFVGRFTDENLGISQEGTFFDYDDTTNTHTANTDKTVLKTVAIPGKTLTNGRSLRVEAFGTAVSISGSGAFDLHLDYGSTNLIQTVSSGLVIGDILLDSWYMTAFIKWVSDSSQEAYGMFADDTNVEVKTERATESSVADLNLTLNITLNNLNATIGCDLFFVKSVGDALALPRGR